MYLRLLSFRTLPSLSLLWSLRFRRHWLVAVWLHLLTMLTLGACATLPRSLPAADVANYEKAQIAGFTQIRAWGDVLPPYLDRIIEERRQMLRINPKLAIRDDLLALSGGGADGAYGAGFLKGWTDRGDRPEFSLVTGVSTGALIAPFAYLGSGYDDQLRRFYTETTTAGIIIFTPISALFGGASFGDSTPLQKQIEDVVTAKLVRAIARQHARGRLLLIGTTNLDAQRQMIWNIGRIASSRHPEAVALIRKILLASASIPGVFPPVEIDVTIGGKRYQELHVDGGVTHEVFAYPSAIRVRDIEKRLGISPKKTLWVIRNKKIEAVYQPVALSATKIAERSISTLIKYQGRGDMIDLEHLARRDRYRFRLTSVPSSFEMKANEVFDPLYMKALYKVGYQAGLNGQNWRHKLGNEFSLKPSKKRW